MTKICAIWGISATAMTTNGPKRAYCSYFERCLYGHQAPRRRDRHREAAPGLRLKKNRMKLVPTRGRTAPCSTRFAFREHTLCAQEHVDIWATHHGQDDVHRRGPAIATRICAVAIFHLRAIRSRVPLNRKACPSRSRRSHRRPRRRSRRRSGNKQCPDRIGVGERVQRDAALPARGVIPEQVRHHRVSELVDGHRDEQDQDADQDPTNFRGGQIWRGAFLP